MLSIDDAKALIKLQFASKTKASSDPNGCRHYGRMELNELLDIIYNIIPWNDAVVLPIPEPEPVREFKVDVDPKNPWEL